MVGPIDKDAFSRLTKSLDDRLVTVRPGESLETIAARHKVTSDTVLQANPHIRDLHQIMPGVQLVIPRGLEAPLEAEKEPELKHEVLEHTPQEGVAKQLDTSLEGQVRAALLKNLKFEKVAPPTPQTDRTDDGSRWVKRMNKQGMEKVKNPPTDEDLRNYYENYAPAHELIAKGDYRAAAEEYAQLQEPGFSAFRTEQQLKFTAAMQDAGVKDLKFPPTQQNLKDYFKILGSKKPPLSNRAILNQFENYVRAFYRHSGLEGKPPEDWSKDIVYGTKTKKVQGKTYDSNVPESWGEVADQRTVYANGTRRIDCEAYAYMAKELLGAAGFKNGKFVTVGPPDDPSTSADESNNAHVMFTAERGGGVVVVSNDRGLDGSPKERDKLLDRGYPRGMGGPRVEDSEQWKSSYKYENRP